MMPSNYLHLRLATKLQGNHLQVQGVSEQTERKLSWGGGRGGCGLGVKRVTVRKVWEPLLKQIQGAAGNPDGFQNITN